jgi:hypothetical protein
MINLIPYSILFNPIYFCAGPEKPRAVVADGNRRGHGVWGHWRTLPCFYRTGPHIE